MGFIRKVFGILLTQITFTAVIVGLCMIKRKDPKFIKIMSSPGVKFGALGGFLATYIALACCRVDKLVPINYILLTIFTLCKSVLVASIAMSVPDPTVVACAAALTAATVCGIFVYAMRTDKDFTVYGPLLWQLSLMFCVASLFIVLFGPRLHYLLAFAGVILFGFFLIVDI